jgi:hypothetical protein
VVKSIKPQRKCENTCTIARTRVPEAKRNKSEKKKNPMSNRSRVSEPVAAGNGLGGHQGY